MKALTMTVLLVATLAMTGVAARSNAACPVSDGGRFTESALVVTSPGRESVALTLADLAQLPPAQLTQKRTVSFGSSGLTEQSVVYGGVLLRDVVRSAGIEDPTDQRSRISVVQAVATDGYRAVFSWGELFNSPGGDQVLVITSQDGQALNVAEGPLALRALSDARSGPRHVRNLCGLMIAVSTNPP